MYNEVKVLYTINFSATNFGNIGLMTDTNKFEFMLRRDIKMCGKIEEALNKLLEIKKIHQNVKDYNPCALFRIFNNTMRRNVKKKCKNFNLNYVDLNDRKSKDIIKISDLCKNNNIYDVIITKNKITEGIDLQRCHVIYFGNYPKLNTELQTIGRSKRNALFWKEDFDIFDPKNLRIAEETKKCYIFFNLNAKNRKEIRERLYCDLMSIEKFQKDIDIEVKNGICKNIKRALIRPEIGIRIIELEKKTGKYHISYDQKYNANIVNNEEFYKPEIGDRETAIIGPDLIEIASFKDDDKNEVKDFFHLSSCVSAKISHYCKFNNFITQRYKFFLEQFQSFGSDNAIKIAKHLKSVFGACVEYYAKIKILESLVSQNKSYAKNSFYIIYKTCEEKTVKEYNKKYKNKKINKNAFVVNIALRFYAFVMRKFQILKNSDIIYKKISIVRLSQGKNFVNNVVELGEKVVKFVLNKMNNNISLTFSNPCVSVKYIKGLCDFLNKDTIIDIKCKKIDKKDFKQILSYYYLSTKRHLKIKKLIIFEAISQKFIEFDLENNVVSKPIKWNENYLMNV